MYEKKRRKNIFKIFMDLEIKNIFTTKLCSQFVILLNFMAWSIYVQLTKECLKCLAPEIMNGPFNLSGLQFTFANVARLQNKINNNSLVQGEVYLK